MIIRYHFLLTLEQDDIHIDDDHDDDDHDDDDG